MFHLGRCKHPSRIPVLLALPAGTAGSVPGCGHRSILGDLCERAGKPAPDPIGFAGPAGCLRDSEASAEQPSGNASLSLDREIVQALPWKRRSLPAGPGNETPHLLPRHEGFPVRTGRIHDSSVGKPHPRSSGRLFEPVPADGPASLRGQIAPPAPIPPRGGRAEMRDSLCLNGTPWVRLPQKSLASPAHVILAGGTARRPALSLANPEGAARSGSSFLPSTLLRPLNQSIPAAQAERGDPSSTFGESN